MTFTIEKNVDLPKKLGRWKTLPLDQMEIGDSILVSEQLEKKEYLSLAAKLSRFNKSNFPRQLTMRTIRSEGIRIFRIEDAENENNEQAQSAGTSGSRTVTGSLYARGESSLHDPANRQSEETDTEPSAQ
jgi:hypothetical protein